MLFAPLCVKRGPSLRVGYLRPRGIHEIGCPCDRWLLATRRGAGRARLLGPEASGRKPRELAPHGPAARRAATHHAAEGRAAPRSAAAPRAVALEDGNRVRLRGRDLDRRARGRNRATHRVGSASQQPSDLLSGRIAHSLHGTFDGNTDVYVVPSTGGELNRLTYSPSSDVANGFTPDGKKVLFHSMRATPRDLPKLFTIPLTGGLAEQVPLPSGTDATYSPDGARIAYVPFPQWQPDWKKYRGGQTTPIWVADLSDSHMIKLPRDGENQRSPMWQGDAVYFVSDRDGPFSLWASDGKGSPARMLYRDPNGWDVRSASVGPGAIVFETLGALHLFDLATNKERAIKVEIADELPQVRARFEAVTHAQVLHAAVSPTGKRVLFEAHGEILSVPKKKGDTRNLTRSPGIADRDPTWSPDGKWVAWLSDRSGEYALYFRSPDGLGDTHVVALGTPPSFFYTPRWSPDSKKIAITDKRLNSTSSTSTRPRTAVGSRRSTPGATKARTSTRRGPRTRSGSRTSRSSRTTSTRSSSTRSMTRRRTRSPTAGATRRRRASIARASTSTSSRAPTWASGRAAARWSRWATRRRATCTPWCSRRRRRLRSPPRATRRATPASRTAARRRRRRVRGRCQYASTSKGSTSAS